MTERDRRLIVLTINLTASANDHEALLALRKAQGIAQHAGLTLTEALQTGVSTSLDRDRIAQIEQQAFQRGIAAGKAEAANQPTQPIDWNNWHTAHAFCLHHIATLSDREREFIDSMRGRRSASPKQIEWMQKIARNLWTRGAR